MLHLILGPAGSGKTTRIYEELLRTAREGRRAILVVPEQFSFESEKELYRRLGPQLSSRVEVLSFTRLCNSVFREYGGLAERYITDTGRYVLMSTALGELRDTLEFYHGQGSSTAFVTSLVETVREFKSAGILPEDLSDFSRLEPDGVLKEKTGELAMIYGAYQALIHQGYADSDEDLIRASAMLEGQQFFAGAEVFVDSFIAFTAAEYRMLAQILTQAGEVWCALCCDGLDDWEEGLGVFSSAKDTAGRLLRMARENGSAAAAPEILYGSRRFEEPALAEIEEKILRPMDPDEEKQAPSEHCPVAVYGARDPYDEIQQVASGIRRMVREEGFRYRDFAVICRSLDPYAVPVERVFRAYDIPFFMDARTGAENTPVAAGILAALEAVRRSFDTERMLRCGKSLITGISADDMALLENYCYIWDIRGPQWRSPFTGNPQGLADAFTEEDQARLEAINRVRSRIVEPLTHLEQGLQAADGLSFGTAVYGFLEEIGAGRNLTAAAEHTADPRAFLEEQEAIWDQVMELLDVFALAVGERRLGLPRLVELLTLGMGTIEVGRIPQTLDQVIVGMADRIRPDSPRATFVIGACEGEFPAAWQPGGLFTDVERTRMMEEGLSLSQNASIQSAREKYYAYSAVTTPSRRLIVSYPKTTLEGESRLPSALCRDCCRILSIEERETDPVSGPQRIWTRRTALDAFAAVWEKDTPARASLHHFLEEEEGEMLQRLEDLTPPERYTIRDPEISRGLFGRTMAISPTRLENFYKCPFAYFCQSGLRVKPRRKVEFNPLESGTVIHLVLEKMLQKYTGEELGALSEEELRAEIRAIIDDYLAQRMERAETLPRRFFYLYGRLVNQLSGLMRHISREFAQSRFRPEEFELPIQRGGKVQPLLLETPGGARIWVEGTVDRVDVMEENGQKYIRVVDYKSRGKKFDLTDVYYGLNMQMLIYLFSIWANGTENLADGLPAGVLYLPALGGFVTGARDASEAKQQEERDAKYKMSGLILDDPTVVDAMEHNCKGVFIPVKYKADGSYSAASSVADLVQMGQLRRHIEHSICQMADLLLEGQVQAVPTQGSNYDPCKYCDYGSVCGREDGQPVRLMEPIRSQRLFELLEEEK